MSLIAFALMCVVAVFFCMAGTVKLLDRATFEAELSDYDLLPRQAVTSASWVIPVTEVVAGAAILLPATRAIGAAIVALLLIAFTLAVATNIMRGRTDVRCACFGRMSQRLSWAIPFRNMLMLLTLGLSLLSLDPRITAPGVAGAVLASTAAWVAIQAIAVWSRLEGTSNV